MSTKKWPSSASVYSSPFSEYKTILSHCKIKVPCHFCTEEFIPQKYSYHLEEAHSEEIPKSPYCAACCNYTWRAKDKTNYNHRVQCWKNKIAETIQRNNQKEKEKNFGLINVTTTNQNLSNPPDINNLLYGCHDCNKWFDDNAVNKFNEKTISEYAYLDIPCNINDWWSGQNSLVIDDGIEAFAFDKEKTLELDPLCGVDGNWMFVYLMNQNMYRWYHYTVPLDKWDKFFNCAIQIPNICGVMPYWCLSSGVTKYRLFRHIIVFTKKTTSLEEILSEAIGEDNKRGSTKQLYVKEIKSVKKFMETWNSISGIKICVDFKVGKFHYYQNRSIGPHSLFWMALYLPDGMQYVTEILKENLDVTNYQEIEKISNDQYGIKYRYIWKDLQSHVIPLVLKDTACSDVNRQPLLKKLTLGDVFGNRLFIPNTQQQETLKALDNVIGSYQAQIGSYQAQIGACQAQIGAYQAQIAACQAQIETDKKEKAFLTNEVNIRDYEIEKLLQQHENTIEF